MITAQKVIHKEDCKRVFKNYDKDCPRCQELMNGSPAREGWGRIKKEQEARTLKAISEHYRSYYPNGNKCGNIVCTCFDW